MATICLACNEHVENTYVNAGGKVFHVEHFKCASCDTLLGGKNFLEKSGFHYCEDDYFKLFGKMCGTCHEIIRGECFNAMGQTYHPEHFVCTICAQPLPGPKFFRKDDKPYCEDDFLKLATHSCAGCGGVILEKIYTAMDKFWHKECFKCGHCNREIGASQFAPYGDVTYHLDCFGEAFSVNCAICGNLCDNDYLDVEGKSMHEACFKCFDCKTGLVDAEWFQVDEKYYCQKDFEAKYQPRCVGCDKVIVGDYIDVKGKNFHEDHFVCFKCQSGLDDDGNFDLFEGEIHCQNCISESQTKNGEKPTTNGKPIEETALNSYKYTFHEGEDLHTQTNKGTHETAQTEENEIEDYAFYTYEQLTSKPYPEGINPDRRELHLSDHDFVKLMGMSKDAFLKQPTWKQLQKKRNLRLY